jgi:hypothetical protein
MLEWPRVLLPPVFDLPFRGIFSHVPVFASLLAAFTKKPEGVDGEE